MMGTDEGMVGRHPVKRPSCSMGCWRLSGPGPFLAFHYATTEESTSGCRWLMRSVKVSVMHVSGFKHLMCRPLLLSSPRPLEVRSRLGHGTRSPPVHHFRLLRDDVWRSTLCCI